MEVRISFAEVHTETGERECLPRRQQAKQDERSSCRNCDGGDSKLHARDGFAKLDVRQSAWPRDTPDPAPSDSEIHQRKCKRQQEAGGGEKDRIGGTLSPKRAGPECPVPGKAVVENRQ